MKILRKVMQAVGLGMTDQGPQWHCVLACGHEAFVADWEAQSAPTQVACLDCEDLSHRFKNSKYITVKEVNCVREALADQLSTAPKIEG